MKPEQLDLGGRCRFAKLVAKKRRKPRKRRSRREKRVLTNKERWLKRGLGKVPHDELARITGLPRQTIHQAARRYSVTAPARVLGRRWKRYAAEWQQLTAAELAEREGAAVNTVHAASAAYGLGKTRRVHGAHVWTVDELDSPERCRALAAGVTQLRLPVAQVARALRVSPHRLVRWVRLGLGGTMERVPPRAPSQSVCRLLAAMLDAKAQQVAQALEALRGEVIGKPRPPPKAMKLPRV